MIMSELKEVMSEGLAGILGIHLSNVKNHKLTINEEINETLIEMSYDDFIKYIQPYTLGMGIKFMYSGRSWTYSMACRLELNGAASSNHSCW